MTTRFSNPVAVPAAAVAELAEICPTDTAADGAGADWWPISINWAEQGALPQTAAGRCTPADAEQVAAAVRVCARHRVPLTVAGGRSGVCGASIPVRGGIVLDLTELRGVTAVDPTSGLITALAGTFGPELEAAANAHDLTVGHFPQSFDISTVGGWVACRGAGQFSTRYGKIDRMVAGLDVVLADGTPISTPISPAGSAGLDLTQLFLGSEGTLGVITSVTLRAHPRPPSRQLAGYAVDSFERGIEVCRRVLRRGATPAVLRLYDAEETGRSFAGDGSWAALVVLDEGDPAIIGAAMTVVAEEAAAAGARALGEQPVEAWLDHRNDTSALRALIAKGFVVDTMEVGAPWVALPALFEQVRAAVRAVPHCLAASCHLSHSYPDGACLYFTFAARPPADAIESTYVALWDAAQGAALDAGANLSHHHGIGLNRARFMSDHLGAGLDVAVRIKQALDPQGILNPAKLGYPSPFGQAEWP